MREMIDQRQAELERKASAIELTQQWLRAKLAEKRELVRHKRTGHPNCIHQASELQQLQRKLRFRIILARQSEVKSWNK